MHLVAFIVYTILQLYRVENYKTSAPTCVIPNILKLRIAKRQIVYFDVSHISVIQTVPGIENYISLYVA